MKRLKSLQLLMEAGGLHLLELEMRSQTPAFVSLIYMYFTYLESPPAVVVRVVSSPDPVDGKKEQRQEVSHSEVRQVGVGGFAERPRSPPGAPGGRGTQHGQVEQVKQHAHAAHPRDQQGVPSPLDRTQRWAPARSHNARPGDVTGICERYVGKGDVTIVDESYAWMGHVVGCHEGVLVERGRVKRHDEVGPRQVGRFKTSCLIKCFNALG